jgi:hypothetical protein
MSETLARAFTTALNRDQLLTTTRTLRKRLG